ncbi:unnamed protein product [Clonostachys rosea]|uniref:Uncharacterized protein n=1 Tax=Bionectria ochroleuca TaxID=29856 RepID=A0ABY6TV30_BIOOC|nr:unnamed protein product [Clonostachys rosea]
MPVTIQPRPDKAGVNTDRVGPEDRLVLRTSFEDLEATAISAIPYSNGFVHGIIRAFEQDLHLVLRPDDIWLAILVQFNFYVNANAEELRHLFVTHKEKKALAVDMCPISLSGIDFQQMSEKLEG